MSRIRALMAMLLCSAAAQAQQPPVVVEEWLFNVVDAKPLSGPVRYFSSDQLPQPPVFVREQKGNEVQVLLRRLGGLYWIPRYAVRLNQEQVLQLTCQENLKSRQADYRTYGMRGLDDDAVRLHCINSQAQSPSHQSSHESSHEENNNE